MGRNKNKNYYSTFAFQTKQTQIQKINYDLEIVEILKATILYKI